MKKDGRISKLQKKIKGEKNGQEKKIPPGAWIVSCECCELSGRGLCDGMVTRPEESYRMWCVKKV
jgi:hypothetical protein